MSLRAPVLLDVNSEAAAFVRFCYERRRVGWPELYDEMCSVAGRRLYEGWGPTELADRGIGFRIEEMATLADLVRRVVAEDPARQAVAYRLPNGRRVTWRAIAADALEQAGVEKPAVEKPAVEKPAVARPSTELRSTEPRSTEPRGGVAVLPAGAAS